MIFFERLNWGKLRMFPPNSDTLKLPNRFSTKPTVSVAVLMPKKLTIEVIEWRHNNRNTWITLANCPLLTSFMCILTRRGGEIEGSGFSTVNPSTSNPPTSLTA
jgi:hypothetical protein